MATIKAFLLQLMTVCFLAFCAAKQNCSEFQCKAVLVGENIASEFESKASEKGVRMVYLNLEIGNDSYHPLELEDEFFPERWVWARSISEPMLSLPYDYDILSLGLLNNQVRSMTVKLEDQPSGCLAALNSSCQNLAVGRALLDNFTHDAPGESSRNTEVVCVAMIETDVELALSSVKYHCCSPNMPVFHCDLPVESSNWFGAFKTCLNLLSVVVLFYWPALLLLLPDCIFNLQDEFDKEERTEDELSESGQVESIAKHTRSGYERIRTYLEQEDRPASAEEIPVDDASPLFCSTLLFSCIQRLPNLRFSFNVKLAVVVYCIFPFVFYVQLSLYLPLKREYIRECFNKLPPGTTRSDLGFSMNFVALNTFGFQFLSIIWVFASFMTVLFVRPKDLYVQESWITAEITRIIPPVDNLTNSTASIGDKMLLHLKMLQAIVYFSMSFFLRLHNKGFKILLNLFTCSSLKMSHDVPRTIRAVCVLWVLLSILPKLLLGLVLGAGCLVLVLVTLFVSSFFLSPLATLGFSFGLKVRAEMAARFTKCSCCLAILIGLIYEIILLITLNIPISISCNFVVGLLGFIIMGLVLNAEIVTPYVAFFLVTTTNIYLCYANLQSRYKEVKGYILKYWQKESQTICSDQDTISTRLFWFVCDRGFPVKTEVCLMFRNIAVIVTFLFLAVSSIIFFGNAYDISTVVSTIAVFVSGIIPSLFFKGLTKGENFSGWAKIKVKRQIETAVKEFCRERGRVGINNEFEREEGRSLNYTVV